MVGKGDVKGSRIFHQCYLKCCKLQNLTPLNNVLPSANGKVLDFCVDRIKYADWPPILNALSCDLSLHSVSIKCRQHVKTDEIDIDDIEDELERNIFSDPENEWVRRNSSYSTSTSDGDQPEADRQPLTYGSYSD